jgi:hypothetical protein
VPDVARGSAAVPGHPARPEAARGSARVRPAPPAGPAASRPALTDIQTTTGVPATPIPAPPASPQPEDESATPGADRPAREQRPGTDRAAQEQRPGADRAAQGQRPGTDRVEAPKPDKSPTAAEGAESAGTAVNGTPHAGRARGSASVRPAPPGDVPAEERGGAESAPPGNDVPAERNGRTEPAPAEARANGATPAAGVESVADVDDRTDEARPGAVPDRRPDEGGTETAPQASRGGPAPEVERRTAIPMPAGPDASTAAAGTERRAIPMPPGRPPRKAIPLPAGTSASLTMDRKARSAPRPAKGKTEAAAPPAEGLAAGAEGTAGSAPAGTETPETPGKSASVDGTAAVNGRTAVEGPAVHGETKPKGEVEVEGSGAQGAVEVEATPAPPEPSIDQTQVIIPGEARTQIIPVVPGEKTQRIRTPVVPGSFERTARLPVPARLPQPPEVVPPDRRRLPRGGPGDLGHAPAVLLLSSLGVLLVALAYTGGREGTGGAAIAYWIGQVVVFTPVVLRLLSRRMAGVAESFLLVMGLAVNQYLLKWMYSPDQFRFPDELQHWLATTIIVESGELFQPNRALPPAVHFPGLAEMAAAVSSMTGLSVTWAGTLVAGVAHLVFVGVLFVCVLRASNSPAVAGVACATYATALHYLFFSSMFLYQTAALPFFMLAIWATRRWREENGWPFAIVAVGSIAMTTVSHHVTAFALIATLTLLAGAELWTERPRRWSALLIPGVAAVIVSAWILLVAGDVIDYLEAPVSEVVDTVRTMMTGSESASTAPAASLGQLALQGTGLLGLFVLYVAVGRDMINRHDRDSWRWAALAGGGIFFAGNGVRFLGSQGPEIAGRLSTFTYVPISIIAAIALVRAVQIIPSRDSEGRRWWVAPALEAPPPTGRNLVVRVLAGSALVTLLMIGARAGGWPPVGSLLPGPYLAGGFERSVDAYVVDAALWQRDTLGPGNRVGGDVTAVSLSSTYGRQDPVREVAGLYYADEWGLAQDELVQSVQVDYLVVDRRLSTQLPQSDSYFENDPMAGRITEPLSAGQITKFDSLRDVDRLYDNGTVRVYRMGVAR